MAEAGRATHYKDYLHHAERMGLSFSANDFKLHDGDRQICLLVQVLADDCIEHLLNKALFLASTVSALHRNAHIWNASHPLLVTYYC